MAAQWHGVGMRNIRWSCCVKCRWGYPLLHPQRKNFCLHEAKFRGGFSDRNLGMSGSIMSNYQRAESRRSKLEPILHLLELDNADRPDDLFTLLNLGGTLLHLARPKKTLPRLLLTKLLSAKGRKPIAQQFIFILKTLASPKTPTTINQFVHSQKFESRS